MVRILANGDIVQDDDPRAQASRNQQSGSTRQMGRIRHDNDMGQQGGYGGGGGGYGGGGGGYGGGGGAGGGGISIFQVLNQKLLDAGIPRWTLGTSVIEPIVTVGFILALLLLGVKGLFLGAILFAAVKFSGGMDGGVGDNTGRHTGGRGRGSGGGGMGEGRTTSGRVLGGRR